MHILISPNAFKNSLDAVAVAAAIEKGLQQSNLNCTTQCFPIGDGGDGTGKLIAKACSGIFINETVHDPLGREIQVSYGIIDNGATAVIEMATASGLHLIKDAERDPLRSSSFGTGELIKKALDRKVTKIILCVGGSATIDGGTGILASLGIRFLDENRELLNYIPLTLGNMAFIDVSGLDKRVNNCEIIIICDVSNKLLGKKGAAKIFGPQKGANEKQVNQLELFLKQFSQVSLQTTGIDMTEIVHGGAAGGVAAGLYTFLNARLENGIDYFLQITRFDNALEKANLVITGEGAIDLQTLDGKAPFGVAKKSQKRKIPVFALAGSIPLQKNKQLAECFPVLLSINPEPLELAVAIASTEKNLIKTGEFLGNLLQTSSVEVIVNQSIEKGLRVK